MVGLKITTSVISPQLNLTDVLDEKQFAKYVNSSISKNITEAFNQMWHIAMIGRLSSYYISYTPNRYRRTFNFLNNAMRIQNSSISDLSIVGSTTMRISTDDMFQYKPAGVSTDSILEWNMAGAHGDAFESIAPEYILDSVWNKLHTNTILRF